MSPIQIARDGWRISSSYLKATGNITILSISLFGASLGLVLQYAELFDQICSFHGKINRACPQFLSCKNYSFSKYQRYQGFMNTGGIFIITRGKRIRLGLLGL